MQREIKFGRMFPILFATLFGVLFAAALPALAVGSLFARTTIKSNFSGAFASGNVLYTHVDSAHRDQPDFGSIREIHEINGAEYNNIKRTVVQ